MTENDILIEIMRHITILNDDYTKLSIDVAVLKAQIENMTWWFRAFGGAFIVMLATQFWQVVVLRKNNKK